MRQVAIHGPDDVRVDEVPVPEPGPRDVVLRIEACGICGSDLTFARHGFLRPGGAPWPLGHEAVGTVVAAGGEAAGMAPGARMLVNPMGEAHNVIGNGGSEGAFADYLLVRDVRLGHSLLALPADLPAGHAALAEPLGVALHGVNQADPQPDDKVVVYGAGPIGLGAVFWLRRRAVRSIVSVDLSPARLERAARLGATGIIDAGRENVAERLASIHGPGGELMGAPSVGTDIYLDMAGGPGVLPGIIAMGRFGARIVLTAVYAMPVALDLQSMLIKEISLKTAVGYPTELPEVARTLIEAPPEALAPMVSHSFPFARVTEAFAAARQPDSGKVMVLFGEDRPSHA